MTLHQKNMFSFLENTNTDQPKPFINPGQGDTDKGDKCLGSTCWEFTLCRQPLAV